MQVKPSIGHVVGLLGEAVHALVGDRSTFLDRDAGSVGPSVVWGESRYRQLLGGRPPSAVSAAHRPPTSQPPTELDSVALADEIDRTARAWTVGEPAPQYTPAATIARLRAVAGHQWAPEDMVWVQAATRQIWGWCDRIDNLLDPPARWTLPVSCPECGHDHYHRHDSAGDWVRTPALTISAEQAMCGACEATWEPEQFPWLARLVGVLPDNVTLAV